MLAVPSSSYTRLIEVEVESVGGPEVEVNVPGTHGLLCEPSIVFPLVLSFLVVVIMMLPSRFEFLGVWNSASLLAYCSCAGSDVSDSVSSNYIPT